MNIRDIARLANVTPGTVSKVLNNYPDISEATRQHVLQIIKENQYTTKTAAESSNRLLHHVLDLSRKMFTTGFPRQCRTCFPCAFTTPTILFYPSYNFKP